MKEKGRGILSRDLGPDSAAFAPEEWNRKGMKKAEKEERI